MNWIYLLLASIAEVTWAVALKYADGFHNIIPSIITAVGYVASLILLSKAIQGLPLGTAYAIWTGIGIIGTTVLGIFLFKEQLTLPQVICLLLIVVGIVGLKLLSEA